MDKKSKVGPGLFARTEAAARPAQHTPTQPADDAQQEGKEPGRVVAMSVALQNAELDELQRIADSVLPGAVKRGNVMSFAIRYFLREYAAGRVTLRRGAKNMLELPEGYTLPAESLEK